ncbi:MAG: NAD-dependent epimerase/dehydratase family protein [Bdellovibrionota bacterium]
MKILVTGATGSLGSRLVEKWATGGPHAITATGRKKFQGPTHVPFLQGDLADTSFVRNALKGQEIVVHCAALASAWGPWEDFYRANVVATQNVVDACLAAGVRQLIHISTPSVYFQPADRLGIRESDPLPPPATHYAKSKLMADEIVAAAKGLETVMLRPRGIFGPTDQVILPRILRLLRRGRFPLVRGGRPLVDLTHVDNVIHAIECCVDHGRAPGVNGEIFNISNGEPIAVKELVDLIAGQLGLKVRMIPLPLALTQTVAGAFELAYKITRAQGEPPLTKYGLGLLSFDQTLDLTKARERLGYAPPVKLRDGIMTTLEKLA